MTVICCSCKKILGHKEGNGISHGICDDCIRILYPDLWEKRFEQRTAAKPQIQSKHNRAAGFLNPPFPAVRPQ